jgi:hypothetical protein
MARRAGHRRGCASSRSLTSVGSVILAQFTPLLLEHVFV